MTITSGGKIYSVRPIDGAIDTKRTFDFAMDGNNCIPYYTDEMQDITQFLKDAGIYKGDVLPEAKFTILEGENSWFTVGKGEYYNAGVVIHGETDKFSIDAGIGVKGELVTEWFVVPKELKIQGVGGELKISFQTPMDILDITNAIDLSKFTLVDTILKMGNKYWNQAKEIVDSYFPNENPPQVTNQFEFHVDPLAGIKKTDVTDPNYWNGSLLNGGGYNGTANFEVNKDIFDANGKLSNYVNNLMAGNITGGIRPGNVNPSENFFGINYEISGNINSSSQQGKNISYVDPLILDLNGDGVHMSDFGSNPVFFDADNDGSLEQTGWVSAQDGIVVKDLNNNGIIDNISETMSEYFGGTAGVDGGTKPFKDGFAALASLDSNKDGKFDSADADWGKVKVWVDANHDGKTDAGELKSFEELNIKQINLANQAQSGEVRDGNEVLARGTYLTTDGKLQEALAANFLANPNGHKFTQSGTGTIVDTQGSGTIAAVKAYVAGDGGETVGVAVKKVNNATGGAVMTMVFGFRRRLDCF
ncbi:MAG: hypothetical protein WCP79_00985 [Bacillota bacterium]